MLLKKLCNDIKNKNETQEEEEINIVLPVELNDMFNGMQSTRKDSLEDKGILFINSMISKESLNKTMYKLLAFHFDDDFTDDIQLIINSPGGYTDAGWALIDLMKFVKNKIKTIAIGEICSMATYIFIAGDKRVMAPNSTAMIHEFSSQNQGTYTELVSNRKIQDMEAEKEINHLIEHSKYRTKEDVRKYILKTHDHWMSPKEMKDHGLCDEISDKRKKK